MSTVRTVAKNTTALFAAEAVSQVLRVGYFAVLVRYAGPEGMGMIATAMALVSAMFVLVSFGFDRLIVRDVAPARERAGAYVTNVAFVKVVLALLYAASLWLAVRLFGYSSELSAIVLVYGIAYLIKAFTDIGLIMYHAFEMMEYNLIIRIARDVVNVVLSLLAIALGYSLLVVVVVSAVANVVELALTVVLLRRKGVRIQLNVDPRFAFRLAVAALPFAMVAIYHVAQTQLTTLVLSATSSVETVGWLSSPNTLVGMTLILPDVFMRAMFPVFARFSAGESGPLESAYQKSFLYLLVLGLAISVGTFLTAEQLVPLALGPGFERSVPVLKILAWLPLASFVHYVNGNFLTATGREKMYVLTQGLFSLARAAVALIVVPRYGYIGAAYALVVPVAVESVFYSILCHSMLKLPAPWQRVVTTALAALLMAGGVVAALRLGVHVVAIVLVVAPIVYGTALLALRVVTAEDLLLFRQAIKLRRSGTES